ncbi:hypothetical protein PQ610_00535 [Tardisphaera miroshnichenkoae]
MRYLVACLFFLLFALMPGALSLPSTYQVKFEVYGLPSGTLWEVTVNGTTHYVYTNYTGVITVNLTSGSYAWSAPPQVSGGPGTVYRASVANGTVAVPSQALIKVQYIPYYQVNFTSSAGGSVYPSGSSWYEAGSALKISAKPSPGYRFYQWVSSAPFIVFTNDSLPNTTAIISGSGYLEAIFKPVFPIPYWVLAVAVVLIGGIAAGAIYASRRGKGQKVAKKKKVARR